MINEKLVIPKNVEKVFLAVAQALSVINEEEAFRAYQWSLENGNNNPAVSYMCGFVTAGKVLIPGGYHGSNALNALLIGSPGERIIDRPVPTWVPELEEFFDKQGITKNSYATPMGKFLHEMTVGAIGAFLITNHRPMNPIKIMNAPGKAGLN